MSAHEKSSAQQRSGYVGGLAGPSVDAAFYPIDTIKTRLQALTRGAEVARSKKLYAGLAPNTAGSFLSAGSFFLVYEAAKRRTEPLVPPHLAPVVHMGSAAVADVAACVTRVPFELLKQRMQANLHRSTAEAAAYLYRSGGLGAFYTGFLPTLMREVPFDAVEFALYEYLRLKFHQRSGRWPGGLESAGIGAAAGAMAAAATTPVDVVKTRIMTQSVPRGHPEHYAGVRDCFAKIVRQEGVGALFAGVLPRTAWISLGGAVFFSVYEQARQALSGTGWFGHLT